mmetsp:Transcript_45481/g.95485  ORF Transcript_45481/g.95485 Transcript_45481/m.95485 type:complete len:216 (+) Transcript_45481:1093-1740(+)
MALKNPLQQRHLPKIEKFRNGRPHIRPVKPHRFRRIVIPPRHIFFLVVVVFVQTRRGQLVKYPKGALSLDFEHGQFLLGAFFVNGSARRRRAGRRRHVGAFVFRIDAEIVYQQELFDAIGPTQCQGEFRPDKASGARDENYRVLVEGWIAEVGCCIVSGGLRGGSRGGAGAAFGDVGLANVLIAFLEEKFVAIVCIVVIVFAYDFVVGRCCCCGY